MIKPEVAAWMYNPVAGSPLPASFSHQSVTVTEKFHRKSIVGRLKARNHAVFNQLQDRLPSPLTKRSGSLTRRFSGAFRYRLLRRHVDVIDYLLIIAIVFRFRLGSGGRINISASDIDAATATAAAAAVSP